MSSISMLSGLLKGGSLSGMFQSQTQMTRKRAEGDARAAAAGALTRSLLQNAASQGTAPGTPGATGNPLTANLGQLIDLKATMMHSSEDTSLTIKTAEGDTVTLTSHSEVNALKAKLTYAPTDAPAGATTPAGTKSAEGHDDHDDDDSASGVTKGTLREIQIDNKVSLTVVGDLSEQELSDIKKLVANLGDTLEGLRRGGDDQDSNDAQSLQKLDTQGFGSLAGFELHAERTVEVTRIHMQRLPVAPPATVPPATVTPVADPTIAPGKGSINTTPVAAPAPPVGRAKPKAKLVPPTPTPAPAPKPQAPPEPAWNIDVFHSKLTTVADMLRSWQNDPAGTTKPKDVLDPSGPPAQDTPVTTRP